MESGVVKIIAKKLRPDVHRTIGITDCGGTDALYSLSSVVVVLTRLFKKVKTLGILLDSEGFTIHGRAESFVGSLRARD